MKFNVCILKNIHVVDASVFDESAICTAHLLNSSGLDVSLTINKFDPSKVNILFGAGTFHAPSVSEVRKFSNPKNTIIFNMEQIGSGSKLITKEYIEMLADYPVWDYNIHNITEAKKQADVNAFEFPLIPTPSLKKEVLQKKSKARVVMFYGGMVERRLQILQGLSNSGVNIQYVSGSFGDSLAKILSQADAVLNIHYYETSIFETARCLRPFIQGIPIVSELSDMPSNVDWLKSGIIFKSTESLKDGCEEAFENKAAIKTQYEDFLYKIDRTNLVKQAIDEVI